MFTNHIGSSTTLVLTTKGKAHSPRPSAKANHLSWEGVVKALSSGPATVGELVTAIQEANPENQGNAMGYIKYMYRNGSLGEPTPTTKVTTKAKAATKAG